MHRQWLRKRQLTGRSFFVRDELLFSSVYLKLLFFCDDDWETVTLYPGPPNEPEPGVGGRVLSLLDLEAPRLVRVIIGMEELEFKAGEKRFGVRSIC